MSRFVSRLEVHTVTCTTQNTEYALALPANVVGVVVQARATDCRIAFQAGKVATPTEPYFTVKAAQRPLSLDNLVGTNRTLYVASGTNGAVLEVLLWV